MSDPKEPSIMEEDPVSTLQEEDYFTRFMFGRRKIPENSVQQPGIDYEELMNNIDTLVESTRQLKPLFQHVYPKVLQLFQKK